MDSDRMRKRAAIAVVIAAFAVGHLAAVADDIFLFLSGVPGGSADVQHTNWIDCAAVTFGASMSSRGLILDRISLDKQVDGSSPALNERVCGRTLIPQMVVDVKVAAGVSPFYYRMVFSNVYVASVRKISSEEMFETVQCEAQLVRWTYVTEGGAGTTVSTYADQSVNRSGDPTNDVDGDEMADMIDEDDDNDTVSDRDEFWAGTNPTDPDSLLWVRLDRTSDTNGVLTWSSQEGRVYDIWRSYSVTGVYSKITVTPVSAEGGETSRNVTLGASAAFFHVRATWP